MNRWTWITYIGLLVFVAGVGAYAMKEPARITSAQAALEAQYIMDAAPLYIRFCSRCHGEAGEGVGAMPVLNNPALASAKAEYLFEIIAEASHGSAMAAWHVREGGILNDYEITQIVALIRSGEWEKVQEIKDVLHLEPAPAPVPDVAAAFVMVSENPDPHECFSCHEEPGVHQGLFGVKCARCHTLAGWKPAMLVRHVFLLDHGGVGRVDCATCHVATYAEYDCFTCHDHEKEAVRASHLELEITLVDDCIGCHPTGVSGEGELFREIYEEMLRERGEALAPVLSDKPGVQ